jgi:glycosyltransferase involved in cell wall biosynthesis
VIQPARAYHVIGHVEGEFGLAIAARNTVRALRSSGRDVTCTNVVVPPARGAVARGGVSSPTDVQLFQMNPLEAARAAAQWSAAVPRGAPRVWVPFWELPVLPRSWTPLLASMDAVLAPTRFVQSACAAAVGPRVLHHPQAVFLPEGVEAAREEWGLSRTSTVFLVSFDIGSDIDRKNPWAAVEAFRRAFGADDDVQLVIKTRPWPNVPQYAEQARRFAEQVRDPRIRIVERSLSYPEVLRLYASTDVLVALHRSEGLGLHLMEAMSLGKVVVGTNWSGNTDFMTGRNSRPVGYRLVPVASRHPSYQREAGRAGQVWAEPDLADAIAALRELHRDRELRRRLGAVAALDMDARRARMLSGAAFQELESFLAARARRRVPFGAALWTTRRYVTWQGWASLARAGVSRAGREGRAAIRRLTRDRFAPRG